jgi:hypothetical protein
LVGSVLVLLCKIGLSRPAFGASNLGVEVVEVVIGGMGFDVGVWQNTSELWYSWKQNGLAYYQDHISLVCCHII